ncbi:MAG TPA: alpha/beta fold hydrolase, partial [Candidatus Binatia bacterium]
MIQKFLLSLLMVSNLACAVAPPTAAPTRPPSLIALQPCRFPNHKNELVCGKYVVYENRASRAGRMIALNIVLVPAFASAPAPDPVFFFAGGPGQGAARIAAAGEGSLMRELRRERDLVFIDQRGTGGSHRLTCAATADPGSLQNNFGELFDLERIGACRRRLETDADLKLYTTAIAVDDVDEVRQALGYDKINLYGVSYGTLSALQYLRRYSGRVRSALLAGVATPAAKLPLQFAKGSQQAMDRLLADCAADESCHSAFPKLKDDFAALLAAFNAGPVRFELTHRATKPAQAVTLSRGVYVERLR